MQPLSCSAVATHHWLVRVRGGEKVLQALLELLPGAPLYTLIHDPAGAGPGWPAIHTSLLQRCPGARRHYPLLLPLMPWAARRMKLPAADLVMCSDAAVAKAMTPDSRSTVVCYCHAPMRYVWDLEDTYRATLPAPLRPLWPPLAARLRRADRAAAARVDVFVANSQHVANRIRRHYGRESVVVHPPVDLPPEPSIGRRREESYLCVGHHVSYKRLDLAVEACRRLGRRLVVIGDGPDVLRLRTPENAHARFLGWQPDAVVHDHYRRAAGLIFAGEEDFGIVPVEAMAHGCPVIAYAVGGARETVLPGRTGVWFESQSVDSLCDALERCGRTVFDPRVMHAAMQRFGKRRFLEQMHEVLTRAAPASNL